MLTRPWSKPLHSRLDLVHSHGTDVVADHLPPLVQRHYRPVCEDRRRVVDLGRHRRPGKLDLQPVLVGLQPRGASPHSVAVNWRVAHIGAGSLRC